MSRKCAVITGSSDGIGKACALKLAQDGFNIVINYRNSREKAEEVVEEIKKYNVEAEAVQADVSKSDEAKRLINRAYKRFGSIDVLINNVGYLHDSYLLMLGDSEIDKSIDINIKSCLFCGRQAALKMFSQKSGKILNISSISSKKAISGQSLYSAAKGAINSMTAVWAKELAPYGITVNAVAPGFVETSMIKSIPEKKIREYKDMIPLNRFAHCDEVAELVSFLCSDKGGYITGHVIPIDGGLSI